MSVPLQPLLFPLDANCNGVFRHRSISPSGLLDTSISEEVRQGPGLEEEQEAQSPCLAAQAAGTRWPRSPPASPRAPLRVSVPVGWGQGPGVRPGGRVDG